MLKTLFTPRTANAWSLAISLVALSLTGCTQSDFGHRPTLDTWGGYDDGGERPGDKSRDADPDIVCDTNADCGAGEACVEGICQMARCEDAYNSRPPMRSGTRFFVDKELLVADGSNSVSGFSPDGGGVQHETSWNTGGGVIDIASGTFTDDAAEATVVVRSNSVALAHAPEKAISLDYTPAAVAAGDADGDGRDEAVVLGSFGNLSVCDMMAGKCSGFTIQGDGKDITMGDIDADGYAESIMLLGQGDKRLLYVWNHDKDQTNQQDFWTSVNEEVAKIDAGDFDGDGIAEVAAMADDSLFGFKDAKLYLFRGEGSGLKQVSEQQIDKTCLDIAAGDFDMDKRDELVILLENNKVEIMRPSEKTLALIGSGTHGVSNVSGARRIAMGDFDGDSPRARLMNESGELLPGPVVPLVGIHFPPYDHERSKGQGLVFVGTAENMSETFDDTVTMRVKAEVGVSVGLPLGLGAGLSGSIGKELIRSKANTTTISIGTRTIARPTPEMQGFEQGLMLLSCACYHVYRYEIDDPKQRLGLPNENEPFVIVLPVGGTTTAWSSKRYNHMAEALGGLPIMEIPYEVGNLRSYPAGPQRADGSPIPHEDMVFPEVPSMLVSDTGDVGWWLTREQSEANTEAVAHSWDVSGSFNIGPFRFGAGTGSSQISGYTLALGEQAIFGGSVPPILDNPATPEDEYHAYAYSFAPYVYREHYTDANGQDAAYYVMSFAVGEQQPQ